MSKKDSYSPINGGLVTDSFKTYTRTYNLNFKAERSIVFDAQAESREKEEDQKRKDQLAYLAQFFDTEFLKDLVQQDKNLFSKLYQLVSARTNDYSLSQQTNFPSSLTTPNTPKKILP